MVEECKKPSKTFRIINIVGYIVGGVILLVSLTAWVMSIFGKDLGFTDGRLIYMVPFGSLCILNFEWLEKVGRRLLSKVNLGSKDITIDN